MRIDKIDLADNKYAVAWEDGKFFVWRHHERWPEKEKELIGDGFVLALLQKVEDQQEMINDLIEDLGSNFYEQKHNH